MLRFIFALALLLCASPARAGSVLLDGVNDHVAIGHDVVLATPEFTIETWFKRAAGGTTVLVNTATSYPLIARGNAANYFLGTDTSGRLHGQIMSVSSARISVIAPAAVPLNEWHHGALTYDRQTLRLFLDGVQVAERALATFPAPTPPGTRLGQIIYQGVAYGSWSGWMDETRIWNRALSEAELAKNRFEAITFAPGLLARWGFDDAASTTIASDGAHAIPATLTNGATYSADAPPLTASRPTASITTPAGSLSVLPGTPIQLTASASDPDDPIVKVEFYANLTKIGEDDAAPYELEWTPAIAGLFVVRAVAEDASGLRNGAANGAFIGVVPAPGNDALYFDGESAYADAGAGSSLMLPRFTVETRFYMDGGGKPAGIGAGSTPAVALVARSSTPFDSNYVLGINPATNRLIAGFGGNKSMDVGRTTISRGAWHHAAMSFDGEVLRVYLDGALETETRAATLPPLGFGRVSLGAITNANYAPAATYSGFFHGLLDEVRIWDYPRSAAAIAAARATNVPEAPGLITRWSMDAGGTGTLLATGSAPADAVVFSRFMPAAGPAIPPGSTPTVVLNAPAAETTIVRDTTLALEATVAGGDPVERVEFWSQLGKLAEDSSAPYVMNWPAAPVGTHSIHAVARTATGATGVSQAIPVNVLPPVGAGGLYFDGVGDSASASNISLVGGKFTLEGWFRREGPAQIETLTSQSNVVGETIFALSTFSDFRVVLGIRAADQVLVAVFQSQGDLVILEKTAQIGLGNWMHAAVSCDGQHLRVYLDGALQVDAPLPKPLLTSASVAVNLAISPNKQFSNFKGFADEVRLWNHDRSATEIAGARFQQFAAAAGLLAAWTFPQGTGTASTGTGLAPQPIYFNGDTAWTTGLPPPTGTAPSVTINSPLAQTNLPILEPFQISVTASDSDGAVQKVEFYLEGVKVGEDTSAPYELAVTPQEIGQRYLRAVAIDDAGLATTHRIPLQMYPPAGGEGLYFDGVDDSVKIQTDAPLALERFTIEAWVRRDGAGVQSGSFPGVVPIVGRGLSTAGINYLLGVQPDTGKLVARLQDYLTAQASATLVGNTSLPLGEWRHVALTYDGAALRLYVDGDADGSVATSMVPRSATNHYTILGQWPWNFGLTDGAFHGYLDEVRLWTHARSQAAIAADRWRSSFSQPGLLARWAMNEGSGAEIFNARATPATGTISGARWTIGHPAPATPPPDTTLAAAATPRPGESVMLTATPALPADVSRVEFYANGVKIGEATAAPWSIPFAPPSPGRYVITVVTTTTAGVVGASNDLLWEVAPPPGSGGIYVDGDNDYVEFPPREELSPAAFTAETWFRCEGPGEAGLYTTIGLVSPILASGNKWFVGLRPSDQSIVAGWEGGSPLASATGIEYGRWYHVAITARPGSFRVYLDGALAASGSPPASFTFQSVHPLAIGTSLSQDGIAQGAFHGTVDETRLWSVFREAAEIAADRGKEIHNAPSLMARWSVAEGTIARDSGSFALDGILRNGAMSASGTDLMQNAPPAIAPQTPLTGATVTPPASLNALVDGEAGETLAGEFRGREIARDADEFTIAVLPNLANYTSSTNGGAPATLHAMLDWIVANRLSRKIAFVAHTGGLANSFNATGWNAASQAFTRLEDPATTGLPLGIPYGLARGSDSSFDSHFGPSRFANKPWYGESSTQGSVNYFRAGGVDMAVVFNSTLSDDSLRKLFQSHPRRQFIVVNPSFGATSVLSAYPNVVLALGGGTSGESRSIVSTTAHSYQSLLAEFSSRPNGGDGWMRLLTFSPLRGQVRVQTFSPTLNQFELDPNSDFTIGWKSPLAAPHAVLATGLNPAPDQNIATEWAAPQPGRRYEWQASVSDGVNTVPTETRAFFTTNPEGGQPPAVALGRPLPNTTATLPCVIPIAANVTPGDDPIERVEFIVNGLTLYSMASAGTEFLWTPGASGTYQITAAAVDRSGRRTESSPVQVSVAANPNSTVGVNISSPAANATLYDMGTVPITVTTFGNASVSYVEFYINGVYAGRDTEAPFSFPWSYSEVGSYDLQALGVSSALQSATSSFVRVNVVSLATSTVLRQPYLQMASPTAVTVCWRSLQVHPGRVHYGTSPGALTSFVDEVSPTTDHAVRLTGLKPNTRYYYGVGPRQSVSSGNDATTYFTTPPPPGRARRARIWAIGDFGQANAGQTSTRQAYYTFTGTRDTDLMLMLGDNAYQNGTDTDYQNGVFNMYPTLLRRTFTWPAIGNHDTAFSTTYNPAIAYYSIFHLPTAGECGGAPSGTERYYSFDYANIHFVCLDSMTTDRSATGAMATWLRADLAATQARWIIAFWHHPPYSKGGWDSDTNNDQIQMRSNLVPILEEFGVDLVLCGHSHNYERSWFMSGHYGLSSTFTAAMKKSTTLGNRATDGPYVKPPGTPPLKDGAVYIVAGNGASLYASNIAPMNHPAMAVNLRVLGSVVIDVNGPQLDVRMVQATGTATDTFSIVKPYAATDTDGDQLSDEYEIEHGLDPAVPNGATVDSDADGIPDVQEFHAGTHPMDPSSKLSVQVAKAAFNAHRITFPTVVGMRYTAQSCDDLASNVWTPVGSEVAGTGDDMFVDDAGFPRPAKRFYRVIARP